MNRNMSLLARAGFICAMLLALLTLSTSNSSVFARGDTDHAFSTLKHTPRGSAHLMWNQKDASLTVTISVIGLQANTHHPAHIHAGDCSVNGAIIFPLTDVVADAAGVGTSTTVIPNITNGIPATGWYINIHSGPTLSTPAQALPVSCGNINNSDTSTKHNQSVTARLDGAITASQEAFGFASLSLKDGTLTVQMTVYGLLPTSSHAVHIHAGTCEHQVPGAVVHPLATLTADGNGVAKATTVITNVTEKSIPRHAWYINVHFSTDLSTQNGFDPVACGNVNGGDDD